MISAEFITLSGRSQHRQHVEIFRNISFHADPGDVLAILGADNKKNRLLIELIRGTRVPTSGRFVRSGLVSFPIGSETILRRFLTIQETFAWYCRLIGIDHRPVFALLADLFPNLFADKLRHDAMIPRDREALIMAFGYALPFSIYVAQQCLPSEKTYSDICEPLMTARVANHPLVLVTGRLPIAKKFANRFAVIDNGVLRTCEDFDEAKKMFVQLRQDEIEIADDLVRSAGLLDEDGWGGGLL